MDLESLRVYLQVVEGASFTRAGERLGMSRARVSAVVQRLEAELGTRLLQRTTRAVTITDDGRQLAERAQALLAEADEVQALFRQQPTTLRGRVRVDMPLLLAARTLIPRLPGFMAAHPQVEIALSSTDRRVDLVNEGFDCVIRVGVLQDSGLIARPLGHMQQINLAAPSYLAAFGTPRTLEDLDAHRLVRYSADMGAGTASFEYMERGELRSRPMREAITVNNSVGYEAACLAGVGIIQAPAFGLKADLVATGQLVEILPEWRPQALPVTLLHAHRRHVSQRLRVFMDWVADVLGRALDEGHVAQGTPPA